MKTSAVKITIDTGNLSALRQALAEHPTGADTPIAWGERDKNRTHPLHYVSDKVFTGALTISTALALVEVLLEAGANVNGNPSDNETPLLGAASLNAEDIGIRLLEAGANPNATGTGGETALHWAAHQGLHRLVARLLEAGADITIKDKRYNATPLEWAEHGRDNPSIGGSSGHDKVIALLAR